MRKNINKIIAFAIGISVMSGSIVPALAEDSTQQTTNSTSTATNSQIVNGKPLLTLDEAIKSAISIDEGLALDEKKISYQDKVNDLQDKINDETPNTSSDKEDYDKDSAEAKLNMAKQQRDFDEDILIQKVTDKYNAIVTSQMKIDKAAKDLDVKSKNLQNAKLKQSLGMTTTIDLKATELSIENDQNTQKLSENTLKDAQYSFKVLTSKDVTQYSLEQDIKFETLKIDGSIDGYLDNVIDSYLKYSEEIVKLNKDYYDKDYEDDNNVSTSKIDSAKDNIGTTESKLEQVKKDPTATPDDIAKAKKDVEDAEKSYLTSLGNRMAFLQTKLGNYQKEESLSQEKKQFKDGLKTYYTNLLASEDKINYDKKQIELNNEKLKNAKLQYDLGMLTETDYNTQVVSARDLDIQLRSEVINYNDLKEKVQKPWIAFSSNGQ